MQDFIIGWCWSVGLVVLQNINVVRWVWPAVMKMSLTRVGIGVVVVSPSSVNSVTDWFAYGSTVVTERSDILSAGVDSVVVASEAVKFSVSDVVVMPSSETLVVVVSLSSKSASRSAKRSIRFHSQSRGLQLQIVPSWWICRKPEVHTYSKVSLFF